MEEEEEEKLTYTNRFHPEVKAECWKPSLFVLLGFRLQRLFDGSLLLGLVLLGDRWELGLADLVSFGLVELLGFLVEFVQVELSDDVLLVERETETVIDTSLFESDSLKITYYAQVHTSILIFS